MNKKILVIVGVLAGLVAFYFWYNTDERVLLRKADRLVHCFEKKPDDGMISGGLNSGAFRDLLAKSVKIDYQHGDMADLRGGVAYKAEELAQKHLGFLKYAKSVTFSNISMKVLEVNSNTGKVSVALNIEMDPKRIILSDSLMVDLGFVKQEDDWKVNQVIIKK